MVYAHAAASDRASAVIVGVDGRSLRAGSPARGVARYVARFLEALARDGERRDLRLRLLAFGAPSERCLPENIEIVSTRIPSRVLYGASAIARRPRLDRILRKPDVVWLPAVAPVALEKRTRFVLTVHDLSFETGPRDFTRYERVWHQLARPAELARRATFVVVPSRHTRRQILERWKLPAERIRVIPPGPGRPPKPIPPEADDRQALPREVKPGAYILVVGALEPRKRPDLVRDAYRIARRRGLQARLVFAGDGPLRADLACDGVSLLGRVSDDTLDALYRNAMCLVCASREEGFGFPALEAAACGTPVVVSDIPVFSETLADTALRFPSGDAGSLAEMLLRLENDRELRDAAGRAVQEAARRLSWQRAASDLADVFRAAVTAE